MKLNINFDKSLEEIINLCDPLADWFERNQETMAYFELTHKDCLHFENSIANTDLIVLGRMANAGLTYLESKESISPENKARLAALNIATVYNLEKDKLSETAKIQYFLNTETLREENNLGRSK